METTMICVDNSEWTRNGDYAPCRFQAQRDAVNLLAGSKTETNAENTVGLMIMSDAPRIRTTPTPDLGKILSSVQGIQINGESCAISQSLQIAQLALKHRQNKLHRQRIILFVASPIAEDKDTLVKLAKKLKKNNVAVDIISCAAEDSNTEKLEAFQDAVNSADNSHLISVPAGTILVDELYATPVFRQTGMGGLGDNEGAAEGVPSGMEGLGVDPNLDPELALALRVSLEEEQARQQRAQQGEGGTENGTEQNIGANQAGEGPSQPVVPSTGGGGGGGEIPVTPVNPIVTTTDAPDSAEPMEVDEDVLLQQALAMSMAEEMHSEDANAEANEPEEQIEDTSMFGEYDEELQNAIRMSMAEVQPGEEPSGKPKDEQGDQGKKDGGSQ